MKRIERFVSEHADKAYAFALSLCADEGEAQELVQEAFFRLLRGWSRYDQSQSLENWFCAVLRHVYFDGLKRYERRHGVSLDDFPAGEDGLSLADRTADGNEEDMLDRLEREEAVAEVRSAMDGLTAEHRAILTLCDREGLGYGRIAQVLDCPLGTVRSRICRARAALKARLRKIMNKRRLYELR